MAVYATEQKELLPKMAIGVKTYEFSATTVVSDQSINVYVRDVTAENVISRLPDRNPAPVLRMSSNGELIYSNHAALPIVRTLKLRLNQPLPSEMVEAFMNGAEDPNFSFELEAEGHAFAFVSEHVPEFGMYNLYGTDISAIKALTRFPKLNPNPVLRVDDSNHLIYANPAASQLLEPFQLCIGDELPSLFAQTVIDAVHKFDGKDFRI